MLGSSCSTSPVSVRPSTSTLFSIGAQSLIHDEPGSAELLVRLADRLGRGEPVIPTTYR